jgi:hypothetical protein
MIYYIFAYYLSGVLVTLLFIYHYRYENNKPPKVNDLILGMIGPWIFPLQIIYFIYLGLTKK